MHKKDGLISTLEEGYHFTDTIPQIKSFCPTPEARAQVGGQLANIYKSYILRSVLSLQSIGNLSVSLTERLEVFAPFVKLSVCYVRKPSSNPKGRKPPPISQILIDNNVHACHWYPQKTVLYQATFESVSKDRHKEEIGLQTEGIELPLAWFQYSCQIKKPHGLWKTCCDDQFAVLVLKATGKDSPIDWNNPLIQSVCRTPIPELRIIKEKLAKLHDVQYRATLKESPNLCEFDLGLYESILNLALPEDEPVDLPSLDNKKEDNKNTLLKSSPANKKAYSDDDLMEGIRQERLAAQKLRAQREEEQRAQEERERREALDRPRQDLERDRNVTPAAQQRNVIIIKPKKKKNNGNNKKGAAKQKPLPKKNLGKAIPTTRSKKSEQIGHLPRISSEGEAPLPQTLRDKLNDVVQRDTPAIVIKEYPTTSESHDRLSSTIEKTPESSRTPTPTRRRLKKKQTRKFPLGESLVSTLEALDASISNNEADEEQDLGGEEEFDPYLLQVAKEQSIQSMSTCSSFSSLAVSSSPPATVPRSKPREQKKRHSRNTNPLRDV